jgi:hypothetical protein
MGMRIASISLGRPYRDHTGQFWSMGPDHACHHRVSDWRMARRDFGAMDLDAVGPAAQVSQFRRRQHGRCVTSANRHRRYHVATASTAAFAAERPPSTILIVDFSGEGSNDRAVESMSFTCGRLERKEMKTGITNGFGTAPATSSKPPPASQAACAGTGCGCSRKKRTISRVASGPRGSV